MGNWGNQALTECPGRHWGPGQPVEESYPDAKPLPNQVPGCCSLHRAPGPKGPVWKPWGWVAQVRVFLSGGSHQAWGCHQSSHLVNPKAFAPSPQPYLLLAALVHSCPVKGEERAKAQLWESPRWGLRGQGDGTQVWGQDCGRCHALFQGQLLLQKAGNMWAWLECLWKTLPYVHPLCE